MLHVFWYSISLSLYLHFHASSVHLYHKSTRIHTHKYQQIHPLKFFFLCSWWTAKKHINKSLFMFYRADTFVYIFCTSLALSLSPLLPIQSPTEFLALFVTSPVCSALWICSERIKSGWIWQKKLNVKGCSSGFSHLKLNFNIEKNPLP